MGSSHLSGALLIVPSAGAVTITPLSAKVATNFGLRGKIGSSVDVACKEFWSRLKERDTGLQEATPHAAATADKPPTAAGGPKIP